MHAAGVPYTDEERMSLVATIQDHLYVEMGMPYWWQAFVCGAIKNGRLYKTHKNHHKNHNINNSRRNLRTACFPSAVLSVETT